MVFFKLSYPICYNLIQFENPYVSTPLNFEEEKHVYFSLKGGHTYAFVADVLVLPVIPEILLAPLLLLGFIFSVSLISERGKELILFFVGTTV